MFCCGKQCVSVDFNHCDVLRVARTVFLRVVWYIIGYVIWCAASVRWCCVSDIVAEQYSQCGSSTATQSQTPEDGHITARNMYLRSKYNKWHLVGFFILQLSQWCTVQYTSHSPDIVCNPVISGSLSPQHGASSRYGWKNVLQCGGELQIYWISSGRHPKRGGPPAWGWGEVLTTPHCKNVSCYEMFTRASVLQALANAVMKFRFP